jgi:SH3 domain protein
VKRSSAILCILMSFSSLANARTVYISDMVEIPLRIKQNEHSKITKMVPNCSMLNLLRENDQYGFSYVQTLSGAEGYVPSRFLSDQPVSPSQLEDTAKKMEQLLDENKQFHATHAAGIELGKERDKLSAELTEIQQTAANAIQLKHERDQLQERVIAVERELQQLKRDNQALTDSTNQDWFIYGGGLALIGVLMGFILPKLSWRRRSSGWGDSF